MKRVVLGEGIHRASKSLIDQPLGEILDKKNVHVAEDEAVSSVSNLAIVIESRLNILHEFAQAVQERNILGTPEGLQFLDKNRALHYPRIVPLVEPTAGLSQLAEENEQLKRENALIQEENDDLAHDLGQRDADAEFNASSSSGQSRRPQFEQRRRALVERLLLVLAFLATAGLGYWIAYLAHVETAFAHGRAEAELQLRHIAELNASESGRIAAEAQTLAAEKDAWQAKARLIIKSYLERSRAELLGIRTEDANQVAGEPFLAIKIAGELLRASGMGDGETSAYYQSVRADVIRELTQYLYPESDVSAALISLAYALDGDQ